MFLQRLAIATAVLGPQPESPRSLFVILPFVLTASVPIGVTEINPQAAAGIEHFAGVGKNIHKLSDELLGFLLKPKLPSHTVVALPIERWRRDDAVGKNTSLAQPTQYFTHFTAKKSCNSRRSRMLSWRAHVTRRSVAVTRRGASLAPAGPWQKCHAFAGVLHPDGATIFPNMLAERLSLAGQQLALV